MSNFICPNCKQDFDVNELELWEVYEEDGKETEFKCDSCDADILITSSIVAWSFDAEFAE